MALISSEYVLVGSLTVIGLTSGLVALRDSVNDGLNAQAQVIRRVAEAQAGEARRQIGETRHPVAPHPLVPTPDYPDGPYRLPGYSDPAP